MKPPGYRSLNSLLAREKSENRHWLSDESDSGVCSKEKPKARDLGWEGTWLDFTPPRHKLIIPNESREITELSPDASEPSKKHRSLRSDATITQRDFDALHRSPVSPKANMLAAMMQGAAVPRRRSSATEKPLPPPPAPLSESASELPLSPSTTTTSSNHTRVSGTSISSMSSLQRQRARKTWRGKACWISLPSADGTTESAGIKKPLSSAEVQSRLDQWQQKGFSISGFDIQDSGHGEFRMPGQSREIYPALMDIHSERQRKEFRVCVPDKKKWDEYMRERMEEKLRALGVGGKDEDSSVTSPPLLAMSRQTSTQNSMASPLVGPMQSAGGFRNGRENTFSPPLTGASAHITRPSSIIQPSGIISPGQLGSHLPKQSVAFPGDFGRARGPPYQPQPTPPLSGPWPHQQYLGSLPGSRVVSPSVDGRPIRTTQSPISPLPEQSVDGLYTSHSPFLPAVQQARDRPAIPQQQAPPLQNVLHRQMSDLVRAGERSQQPTRFISQPEIASPLPQGHRHNLSETLQKEIDDAEQHLEDKIRQQLQDDKARSGGAKKSESSPQGAQIPNFAPARPEVIHEAPASTNLDTNPSVASSPRQINSTMASLNEAAVSRNSSVSKVGSRLSADAPEFKFDPTKTSFTPMFTFGGANRSVSSPHKPQDSIAAPRTGHSKAVSMASTAGSGLNVAAPAFTPGQFHVPAEAKREFSFTSSMPSSFKPDVPAFKPGHTIDRSLNGGEPEQPRLFANLDYADVIKPAKKSRAIPIVKPQLSDTASEADDGEIPEDETGRITRAKGYQKRARRRGGSGDEVPLFATPSREVSAEPPSQEPEAKPAALLPLQEATPKRGCADTVGSVASPVVAATDLLREIMDEAAGADDQSPESKDAEPAGKASAGVPSKGAQPDPVSVSPLTPESNYLQQPEEPKKDTSTKEKTVTPQQPEEADISSAQPKGSTLSATAKPFEFNPNVPAFGPQQPPVASKPSAAALDPKKSKVLPGSGLEASRFAAPSAGLEGSRFAGPSARLEASRAAAPDAGLEKSRFAPPEPASEAPRDIAHEATSPAESKSSPVPDAEESLRARIANGVHYVEAPSYQEIDDVMKQLNGEDSDAGVERNLDDTWRSPARSSGSRAARSIGSREGRSPPTRESSVVRHSLSSDPFLEVARSRRGVSPSPNRLREPFQYLPKQDTTESSDRADAVAEMVKRNARFSPSFKRPRNPAKALDDSPVRRMARAPAAAGDGSDRSVSEWDDVVGSDREVGFRVCTGFFDNRVHELLDGVVDQRLRPLEQSLAAISATLVRMNGERSRSRRVRRSLSAEAKNSDADDEDDEEAAATRPYSPIRDRKLEKLKASVLDAVNSQKSVAPNEELAKVSQELSEVRTALRDIQEQPRRDAVEPQTEQLNQLHDTLKELKSSMPSFAQAPAQNAAAAGNQLDILKAIMELKDSLPVKEERPKSSSSSLQDGAPSSGSVSRKQSRGKSAPITSSQESAASDRLQLKVTGLESMLKIAESRADDELKARQAMETELEGVRKRLEQAELEATQHRESAEETEQSLRSFLDGQQQMKQETALLSEVKDHLQKSVTELTEKNSALEETLEEYRVSHDNWKQEMSLAKSENGNLERTIQSLKTELEDGITSKSSLKEKLGSIQEQMIATTRTVAEEQATLRQRVEEHKAKNEHQAARLEAEARTRERLELEIDRLEKQEKEAMKSRFLFDQVKEENNHIRSSLYELRNRSHQEQEKVLGLERELHDAKESNQLELQRIFNSHKTEMATAGQRVQIMRGDLEAVIKRLEGQMASMRDDATQHKERHELILEEASFSKDTSLREAAEAREHALQEHYRFHERTLEETRAMHDKAMEELKISQQQAISNLVAEHDRALSNAVKDQERAHNLTIEDKKFAESSLNERLALAEEKTSHYQDRVSHLEERLEIAKSAAQAAAAAASRSTKASPLPVASASNGSMQVASGSNVPEKISPQALRESILVLQEQLGARESQIEKLETQLGQVDHDAPKKIKDRDFEITWLRELLGVRRDELQEIVTALAAPAFDRERVRDAIIRLRANMDMEQLERERAAAGGAAFPSIASIAASPRSLPLAAAAAWGNWRKGRPSVGGMAEIRGNSAEQTPSRSSPQSFLSGLLTPPNTQMRPPGPSRPFPKGSRPARPAPRRGGYSTPPRQISGRQPAHASEPPRQPAPPETPTLLRTASYDLDAESTHYSLDRYVAAAATDDESAVGLDEEEENASPEGDSVDEPRAEDDADPLLGPSIELES